jgi:hypothetical protein
LARRAKDRVVKLHRDAQRLLRPLVVVNPFAESLSFLDHATRTRRDHTKYLTLIRTIALLHQYQREVKTVQEGTNVRSYIEATREDIEVANRLCHEILGRSLDELPPQTRRLLGLVDDLVREGAVREGVARDDFRFTRRDAREATQWGQTQLRVHLGRLIEMEYVLVHRGKQGQGYVYELAYGGEGKDGAPFLPGLGDVARSTTETSRGSAPNLAGSLRGDGGPVAGAVRPADVCTNDGEEASFVRLRAVAV